MQTEVCVCVCVIANQLELLVTSKVLHCRDEVQLGLTIQLYVAVVLTNFYSCTIDSLY